MGHVKATETSVERMRQNNDEIILLQIPAPDASRLYKRGSEAAPVGVSFFECYFFECYVALRMPEIGRPRTCLSQGIRLTLFKVASQRILLVPSRLACPYSRKPFRAKPC
jgi:hypothetical protein